MGVWVPKWPFRDANLFSKKWVAVTPIFLVVLGARFFGQVVHQKRKFGLTTEKLIFGGYFLVFLPSFFLFFTWP